MKRVELYTCQRVKEGHEKDYCVRDGLLVVSVESGGGYKKLLPKAKRLSSLIGSKEVKEIHTKYKETNQLIEGLAAVKIMTALYNEDETIQESDFFERGKYSYTIKEVWREDFHNKERFTKE